MRQSVYFLSKNLLLAKIPAQLFLHRNRHRVNARLESAASMFHMFVEIVRESSGRCEPRVLKPSRASGLPHPIKPSDTPNTQVSS
jgi:hypothetical protein